jgi:hypothetical protein
MEVPMTFADFAITEARFRKHFRTAPPTPGTTDGAAAEFLELDADDREGKFPFIWSVDRKQQAGAAARRQARWSSRARTAATSGRMLRALGRRRQAGDHARSGRGRGAAEIAGAARRAADEDGEGLRRRMRLLGLKTFRHGVHPPEAKDDTSGSPIRQFPFAPLLVVPLVQHAGKPSLPVVREGQEVVRGQRLARPDGFMSVAMHAPASGVVRRIALAPSISGRMVPAVYLEPFPGSTQEIADGTPCPLDATPDEIVAASRRRASSASAAPRSRPTSSSRSPPASRSTP